MNNRFFFISASEEFGAVPGFRAGEVILVLMVLSAWAAAFFMFLHYWAKIRLTQPGEPRFKHEPKNLDTIKIVKRNTDMIIYKSYTKEISRTMIAREKRLERMSTMPNIKIGEMHPPNKHHGMHMLSSCLHPQTTDTRFQRNIEHFQTLPVIEVDDTEKTDSEISEDERVSEESHDEHTPLDGSLNSNNNNDFIIWNDEGTQQQTHVT